jgi:cytochrome c oxidase assembly protein subunit 15
VSANFCDILQLAMNGGINRALRNYAVFTAVYTLYLICIGGLVTSHGVGMSVPDWPTTYGYNMFRFPISGWVSGIYHEHTHRLVASVLGVITAALALWLWIDETKGKVRRNGIIGIVLILLVAGGIMGVRRTGVFIGIASFGVVGALFGLYQQRTASGVRWLGVSALSAVIAQGVLGGLRVTLSMDAIGIFHATLAQLFLFLLSSIALYQTGFWRNLSPGTLAQTRGFRRAVGFTTALIFVQLMIAATMRHKHAGLAINDFPLAYGKLWPATDPASLEFYNAHRQEMQGENPITAFQIVLQMIHRMVALAILVSVAFCAGRTRKLLGWSNPLTRLSSLWLGLILVQIFLGAATIWTGKAADIATAHVAVGALSLVTGGLLTLISFRLFTPAGRNNLAPSGTTPFISQSIAPSR